MANVKVELNTAGVRELLKSQETAAMLNSIGAEVQARAGSGYGMDAYDGRNRRNVAVFAQNTDAWRDNLENNTLLKAIGGGK